MPARSCAIDGRLSQRLDRVPFDFFPWPRAYARFSMGKVRQDRVGVLRGTVVAVAGAFAACGDTPLGAIAAYA
jgi:hypothetical protein